MNLFGRKKAEPPPPPTSNAGPTVSASSTLNAITKLRDAGDTLDKREDYLNNKIKKETDEAKKFMGQGKKSQALQCIKRKKMYEGQVEKIGQARLNLETQQLALEQLNLNKEVVEAQREGAKTMASVTAQMGEWLSACALRAVCPVPRPRDMSPRHVRYTSPRRVLD
mmetsp:Transcript_3147/g.9305  ORF Transcript_3147/g.9305 Transcript_3147/m.9305 type:complete len:167 (+) Transcript_3147:85-585(+)